MKLKIGGLTELNSLNISHLYDVTDSGKSLLLITKYSVLILVRYLQFTKIT